MRPPGPRAGSFAAGTDRRCAGCDGDALILNEAAAPQTEKDCRLWGINTDVFVIFCCKNLASGYLQADFSVYVCVSLPHCLFSIRMYFLHTIFKLLPPSSTSYISIWLSAVQPKTFVNSFCK